MFCVKCGTFIEEDAVFCPNCGVKIEKAIETETVKTPSENEPISAEVKTEEAQAVTTADETASNFTVTNLINGFESEPAVNSIPVREDVNEIPVPIVNQEPIPQVNNNAPFNNNIGNGKVNTYKPIQGNVTAASIKKENTGVTAPKVIISVLLCIVMFSSALLASVIGVIRTTLDYGTIKSTVKSIIKDDDIHDDLVEAVRDGMEKVSGKDKEYSDEEIDNVIDEILNNKKVKGVIESYYDYLFFFGKVKKIDDDDLTDIIKTVNSELYDEKLSNKDIKNIKESIKEEFGEDINEGITKIIDDYTENNEGNTAFNIVRMGISIWAYIIAIVLAVGMAALVFVVYKKNIHNSFITVSIPLLILALIFIAMFVALIIINAFELIDFDFADIIAGSIPLSIVIRGLCYAVSGIGLLVAGILIGKKKKKTV